VGRSRFGSQLGTKAKKSDAVCNLKDHLSMHRLSVYCIPGICSTVDQKTVENTTRNRGFGSGSGLDQDSIRSVDSDPDPYSESGSESRRPKVEKIKKFHVLKSWMFFLRAEVFFCNLDVLYGSLKICKL
jgi:hypothetical protein